VQLQVEENNNYFRTYQGNQRAGNHKQRIDGEVLKAAEKTTAALLIGMVPVTVMPDCAHDHAELVPSCPETPRVANGFHESPIQSSLPQYCHSPGEDFPG